MCLSTAMKIKAEKKNIRYLAIQNLIQFQVVLFCVTCSGYLTGKSHTVASHS